MSHIDIYYSTRTKALAALRQLKKNTPLNLIGYKLSVKKIKGRDEYAIFYTR